MIGSYLCKNRWGRLLRFFLAVLLLFYLLPPFLVSAVPDGKVIRVGYYPLKNYHAKDATGNVVGYEADYLNRIAEQTGWKYDFVEADSWVQAVDMLERNEVDLISPAQITEDRISRFGFSALPIGKICGAVMMLTANDGCAYEDFQAFSNMTFGIENGLSYNAFFAEYAEKNGFTPKKIKTYKNSEALINALNAGEIDAMIANIMRIEDNMKLLGKFGTQAYYFMFRKDDAELENALNEALNQIDLESPSYENDLNIRYFPKFSQENLTKAEEDYVRTLPALRLGCPTDMDPISYLDPATGEIAGINRDIMELITKETGVSFEYVPLPGGSITYDDLRALNIDIVSCIEKNGSNANSPGISLTQPYFSSRKVIVGKKGVVYDRNAALKVAVATGSQTFLEILQAQYPQFTVTRYPDNRSALTAIIQGEMDLMVQNQYVVQPFLKKPHFENLEVIPTEGLTDGLCLSPMLYKMGAETPDPILSDRRLVTILNKGIANISEEKKADILIANTTDRPYTFELRDFLYRYRVTIGLLAIFLVVLFSGFAYIFWLRRKSYRLLRKNELKLRNIANNINGGVVVLLPDKGMKITYANEGFLNLVQCTLEEYSEVMSASYVMYVHKEDVAIINDLIQRSHTESGKISVRVRLRRKDGEYIPTRFNGTITHNEHGEAEMFCVIMDISQEVEMLDKLALERRKHNLLMEKANEIVYEIDIKNKVIQASEAFEKVFGWTLTEHYQGEGVFADMWKIHPQDLQQFREMFQSTIEQSADISCGVRLLTQDGTYRWFDISQYAMLNRQNKLRFILGKIVDIDGQVKEKQMLEKKSQTDAMTGLYNKEAFLELAAKYLEESRDVGAAFLFIDLDGFKEVNDRLGHVIGDQAILDTAKTLQLVFSGYDLLARFGGDEFCVLVKEIPLETLKDKILWVLGKLHRTYTNDENSVTITASIGVCLTADCGFHLPVLLQYADEALYQVKEHGKNNYFIYCDD